MKFLIAATVAFVAWMTWAASPVSYAGNGGAISTVNSSVRAEAGKTYGDLSTVNGDVSVGQGATAGSASTVNGNIRIDNDARLDNASTVNGSVRVSEGVQIEREAHTVNGDIQMRPRSRVGGDVETVSGDIELAGAEVGGTLRTHNGDIELTEGAHVRGGILVKQSKGWGSSKKPINVRICSTCVVDGELRFERPVKLTVENGARIGAVIGDEVIRN
jgi:predicted acyltransferase (DUF342 family)